MLATIWNLILAAAAVAVVVALQVGVLAPGDAFFAAIAIVLVFTAQQLIAREHMGIGAAAHSLVTQPESYRSRIHYLAYVACLALGALVAVQVAVLVV